MYENATRWEQLCVSSRFGMHEKVNRRNFLRYAMLLPLVTVFPAKANAWFWLLRFGLRGLPRAGAKGIARRFPNNMMRYNGTQRLFTKLGTSIPRKAKNSPKNHNLPSKLRREVDSRTYGHNDIIKAAKIIIPEHARVVEANDNGESFSVDITNPSDSFRSFKFGFFVYDIDAKEVEAYVVGPVGFLEPNKSVRLDLYMPSPLYPGRKILVTDQENVEGKTSEVFYSI